MYIIIRALVSNWYEDAAEIVVFSKKASMTQLLTRSPAVARKSRPYRLRRKPNVRLLFTERKRFLRGEQFHARYVNETLFSKATISASVTHVAVLLVIGSNLGLISDRFRDTAICTVKLSIKIAAKPLQMKTWLILTAYKKLTAPYPMVRSQILYGLPFSHNTARLTYCSALWLFKVI